MRKDIQKLSKRAIRTMAAVKAIQRRSVKLGKDKMPLKEINLVIVRVRKDRKCSRRDFIDIKKW